MPLELGYRLRTLHHSHTLKAMAPIENVADGHKAAWEFRIEIMTRCWELRDHKGDEAFWAQPHIRNECSVSKQRGEALSIALEQVLSSSEKLSSGSWEHYSCCLDLLHVTYTLLMLELTPFTNDGISKSAQSPYIQNGIIPKAVDIAEKKMYTSTSGDFTPSEFTLDGGGDWGNVLGIYLCFRPPAKGQSIENSSTNEN